MDQENISNNSCYGRFQHLYTATVLHHLSTDNIGPCDVCAYLQDIYVHLRVRLCHLDYVIFQELQ